MAREFDDDDLGRASVGELFNRLTEDMATLVSEDLALFRVEMSEKLLQSGRHLGEGAGVFSAAAVTGFMAVGSLTAFAVLALALVMPAWLSALIIAITYSIVATICVLRGKRTIDRVVVPMPKQTVDTVKEDI